MDKLKELRKEIDLIDNQLIDLFIKRFNLSIEVKKVKQENNILVLDSKREQEIIEKVKSINTDYNIKNAIEEVYLTILNSSKKLQK